MKKKHAIAEIQRPKVYHRFYRNALIGMVILSSALFIGMLGYHDLEAMSWIDAFLNASMILSGMGPAATIVTEAGKLFAGFYALFSGLAFITVSVIMLSPAIHRFFHRIHLESQEDRDED